MRTIPLELGAIEAIPAHHFSREKAETHLEMKTSVLPEPSVIPLKVAPDKPKNQSKPFPIGKWMRRAVAVGLVAVAMWWLALPMLFPTTNQAVVNARLVQIRAPIDGTTNQFLHDLGDRIEAGETLATMANPRTDTTTLSHLKSRHGELSARKESLAHELAQVTQSATTCRETCKSYKRNRVAFLESVVKQSESSLQIARLQFDNAEKEWKRYRILAERSAAGGSELDKAAELLAVTKERIDAEQAALDKSHVELEAAREGVYVSLETPSFLARAEELDLKTKTLKNALMETEQHLETVEKEVSREQSRIDAISNAVAASPVSGVVWKRHGNLGQSTRQNEILYEVAETGSVFVEAQLSQRHLANVVPGSQATILLAGGVVRKGSVRSVNTLGSAEIEPSYAVSLPNRDFKQVRVLIFFESQPGDAELIGRHVRVFLADPSPSVLQRLAGWVFARVGD